ncbi:MAG: sialate O-acetylesterase [Kosmotogaceae bacterium]
MSYGVFIERGLQDWQIFQQNRGLSEISLYGKWADPEKNSNASVYAKVVKENSNESVVPWTVCELLPGNQWKVSLRVPEGGLYRIETALKTGNRDMEHAIRGDIRHHIGVGDLFVIAGQSNSAGYGKDTVYDPPELGVHIFKNNGKWELASHPLNDTTDTIHEINMESINPGHSPYLNFAKKIKRECSTPVGLLQCSLGGSSLSQWNPGENGELYKNMLEIIKTQGGKIRGILWYQGCSDVVKGLCESYLERFKEFVQALRKDLKDKQLPFFTVQLNRFVAEMEPWGMDDEGWAMVRNAQRVAAKAISGVYVIPSLDVPLSDNIHNSSHGNMIIGERLARLVMEKIYLKNNNTGTPDIKRIVKSGKKTVILEFEGVKGSLYAFDLPPERLPIEIIDESGTNGILDYKIEGNKITIELKKEIEGHGKVNCCHQSNPSVNPPVDLEGHIPVLSFYGVKVEGT